MPYPNEHACRVREPGEFQEGSFRRVHLGQGVDAIIGRLKGETSTTIQAYRYPKDSFSAEEARAKCAAHKGRFEAAGE